MSDKEDPASLVCEPVATAIRRVPGTTEDVCSECGGKVTIAPSGRALIAEQPHVKIVCTPCAMPYFTGEKEAEVMVNPKAVDELRAEGVLPPKPRTSWDRW